MKLIAICSFALFSTGSCGKRNRITGRSFSAAFFTSPAFSAISMIPHQNAITPSIVMHNDTASFDESSAAFVSSGIFPFHAPKIIPIRIIPAHRPFNNFTPPFSYALVSLLCIVPHIRFNHIERCRSYTQHCPVKLFLTEILSHFFRPAFLQFQKFDISNIIFQIIAR